ncbi:MAG: pyrroline-5-carboxylate reductase, partial [Nitrospirae bacterium]
TEKNRAAVSASNIIILAVKPQNMEAALNEIADLITDEKTVVSIAAGITLSYLESKLKTKKLIRVMPNTPALVQEGMSVMSLCECFPDKDIAAVREIFMSVGKVLVMPEKYMNIVTALSGSGPAFIAFFIEALIEAGIKSGLGRSQAVELAVQTLSGTAKLLDTGLPPDKLREMVTSPGGTTAAGLEMFRKKGLMDIVDNAINAAIKRAEELGRRKE